MGPKEKISEILARNWLEVNLYCGLSSYSILKKLQEQDIEISEEEVKAILLEMEKEEYISTREIESGDRISWIWNEDRFEKIIELGPHLDLWAYPKRKLLEKFDNSKVEDVGIYTKQLRLGGSQIEHRFFNRQVLERYREDPRFRFEEWGSSGFISIKDEYFLDEKIPEDDKIDIQSFGYAYDKEGNQVVAVVLRYLGSLTIKHQNYWNSFEISIPCKLDPDYVETNFMAKFTKRISIHRAFCQELYEINKICRLMGEPPLFKNTYIDERPRKFGRITKPTDGEFYDFVHILDKMISENLNKKFFTGKIRLTEEQQTKNGKVRIIDKGTIKLLEEYLDRYWNFPDPRPKEEMIETIKKIRKQRQIPAHKIEKNRYDIDLVQKQRDLMNKCYRAIRTLRLIMQNHPNANTYEPPKWLDEGRII